MDKSTQAPITSGEPSSRCAKPFRILIDQIDLALRFGSSDELESACNELLSSVKYDTFEAQVRVQGGVDSIAFSSNPEVVYIKLLTYNKEATGARLEVTCGHCGQRDDIRSCSSFGGTNRSHIQFLLDNFPQEL